MTISRRSLLAAAPLIAVSGLIAEPAAASITKRYWYEGPVLNQFGTEACEAFALVTAWMSATKYEGPTREANRLARYIFKHGGGTDDGSNAEMLLPVAKELGLVSSWTWLDTVDDVVDAVLHSGPVPIGVRMTDRFADTNGSQAYPGSGPWTSHGMTATAYHSNPHGRGRSLRLRNTWGRWWGNEGSAWMTVDDLKRNWGPRPYLGYYRDAYVATWTKP